MKHMLTKKEFQIKSKILLNSSFLSSLFFFQNPMFVALQIAIAISLIISHFPFILDKRQISILSLILSHLKSILSFFEFFHFSHKATRTIKKANRPLPVSCYFLTNKGPNHGNQYCRQEIGNLDSFAPDEVDPDTENKAGANQ